MANGTVKWFNGQKGYGFIQPDEGGNDVFVHISAVERAGLSTLREGQKIAYETETGRNGKVAAVNQRPHCDPRNSPPWGSRRVCSPTIYRPRHQARARGVG